MSAENSILVSVERQNVNDDSVIILAIFMSQGDTVSCDDIVMEIETSKTNFEVTSPADGYLQLHVKVDDEVEIGAPLFSIQAQGASIDGATNAPSSPGEQTKDEAIADEGAPAQGDILLSKAAEQRRQELGVPIASLKGHGWVTVGDVEQAAGLRTKTNPTSSDTTAATPEKRQTMLSEITTEYDVKRKTKRKQAESNNLTFYGDALPQSTIWIDIEVSGTRVVSPPYLFEETIADIVVYESSKLLKNYPNLNAFHINARQYGEYDEVNFGISFDNGENLKVLAIEKSDRLSLAEIQNRIETLLHLYESGDSISQDLLTAATVTLSDLSQSAASSLLPLLNGAQSLILGIARRGPLTYSVAASFDHRVADGLMVSEFLGELNERICSYFRSSTESPEPSCFLCAKTMSEELKFGNRAMLTVKRADGTDAVMCRNCFEGW